MKWWGRLLARLFVMALELALMSVTAGIVHWWGGWPWTEAWIAAVVLEVAAHEGRRVVAKVETA